MAPKSTSKRRRLTQLASAGVVSDSSLSRILARLDSECAHSRQTIRRAVEFDVNRATPYGPVIQTATFCDGLTWDFVHPMAMLYCLCEMTPRFAAVLGACLETQPSTPEHPWRMVWYGDEAVPGNVLSPDNTRKAFCLYWSFVEFGLELLSRSMMWFLGSICRTSLAKRIPGGISRVMRYMFEVMFGCVDPAINMATAGVILPMPDGSFKIVFAKLHLIIGDEKFIKDVWDCKGSSGLKICMLCSNCMLTRSGYADNSDSLVSADCHVLRTLKKHSNATIWGIARRLRACPRNELELRQTQLGFNLNVEGLLYQLHLHAFVQPLQTMYDFFHIFFVGGVIQLEIFLFLKSARQANVQAEVRRVSGNGWGGYAQLHEHIQPWTWPRSIAPPPRNVFSQTRAKHSQD